MPKKTNQLPKDGKAPTAPPPQRNLLLIVAGGALLVLVIIGVVLAATAGRGASSTSVPAQVSGKPSLVIDREKIDFGKVPLNIPIKATFKLSNVGDQPLQILNQPVVEVKQGC